MNSEHIERCKKLVHEIESLSQTEIEEIFKMIHKYNNSYTKNNNGIFVNLSWIPLELLEQLEQYIKFCNRSLCELKKYESICDVLNSNINENTLVSTNKKNKKNIVCTSNEEIHTIDEDNIGEIENQSLSRISSSLRFSLLKKKFSKVAIQNNINCENDLKIEEFIIV